MTARRVTTLTAFALGWALAVPAFTGCLKREVSPGTGPSAAQPTVENGVGSAEPGQVGAKALAFAGTTRDGKPFDLADYRGKTVLVNFFGPG